MEKSMDKVPFTFSGLEKIKLELDNLKKFKFNPKHKVRHLVDPQGTLGRTKLHFGPEIRPAGTFLFEIIGWEGPPMGLGGDEG